MYNKYRRGLITHPCGAPVLIIVEDVLFPLLTGTCGVNKNLHVNDHSLEPVSSDT